LSPNIKPKPKKKKEKENRDLQISLNDIYALIKDMKIDIQSKYQMIQEKVEAMEKSLLEIS